MSAHARRQFDDIRRVASAGHGLGLPPGVVDERAKVAVPRFVIVRVGQPQVSTSTRSAFIQLAVEIGDHELAVGQAAQLRQRVPAPAALGARLHALFQKLARKT